MAKRFNIDDLTDRNDIINKIINQTNTLNKKIKKFKEDNITEHMTFLKTYLTDDLVKFNANERISKSKKFYDDKHILFLKKTLSALRFANNDQYYGTPKKYKQEVNKSVKGAMLYTKKYLLKKGYDESFVNRVTNSKDFMTQLFVAFYEGRKNFDSNQSIEKVALNYDTDHGFSDKEKNEILNNIEYSRNFQDKLDARQDAVEETERNMKMR